MSIVSLRYYGVVAVCDFDYSKFSDEYDNHVKCELSSNIYDVSKLYDLICRVLEYVYTIYPDIRNEISVVCRDSVEIKIYRRVLDKGLSFYDIIDKICMIIGYELWKISKSSH